jgi:hypothetical protein
VGRTDLGYHLLFDAGEDEISKIGAKRNWVRVTLVGLTNTQLYLSSPYRMTTPDGGQIDKFWFTVKRDLYVCVCAVSFFATVSL